MQLLIDFLNLQMFLSPRWCRSHAKLTAGLLQPGRNYLAALCSDQPAHWRGLTTTNRPLLGSGRDDQSALTPHQFTVGLLASFMTKIQGCEVLGKTSVEGEGLLYL